MNCFICDKQATIEYKLNNGDIVAICKECGKHLVYQSKQKDRLLQMCEMIDLVKIKSLTRK